MKRDVDIIIATLKQDLPNLDVVQMVKIHPADDDGLWWFRLPGVKNDIQIESPTGNCPFQIETSDDKSSEEAYTAQSVEEVVRKVSSYLRFLSGSDVR